MTEEYITRLRLADTVVYESTNSSQSDAMTEVVEFLLEERNLLENFSIPYSPGRRKSPLIGISNSDLDEQEHQVGTKYYVDTLFNRKSKKRHIKRIAAECCLEVEVEGEW